MLYTFHTGERRTGAGAAETFSWQCKIMPKRQIFCCCYAKYNNAKSPNEIYNKSMENYRPRLADKTLERKLKGKGAVLIQGPKWCGKTTTAEQMAKSILYMSKPEDVKSNLLQMGPGSRFACINSGAPHFY